MSAGTYAYVNAKVGALRSRLLTAGEYRSLIEVPTAKDMVSLLKSTVYGRDIAKIKEYRVTEIERVLRDYLRKEHYSIIQGVRGLPRQLLERLYLKHEAEVVKEALVLKASGASREGFSEIFPTRNITREVIDRISEARDLREACESLKGTEFHKPVMEAVQKHAPDLFYISTAIDRYIYKRLWETANKLFGRDRVSARELLGTEIDIKNIMTALRLREQEADLREVMLPVKFRVGEEILDALSRVRNLSQFSSEVPRFLYFDVIENAIKNADAILRELPLASKDDIPTAIEHELQMFLVKKNIRMFYGDRFHIGVPMAHIFLKGLEIRNIISALKLKEAGVENEKIERFLIIPS